MTAPDKLASEPAGPDISLGREPINDRFPHAGLTAAIGGFLSGCFQEASSRKQTFQQPVDGIFNSDVEGRSLKPLPGGQTIYETGAFQKVFKFATNTDAYTLEFRSDVESAPEPASWALMLGGFGMIGGAMRVRRKTRVSFA